jgi:hypothetical protein
VTAQCMADCTSNVTLRCGQAGDPGPLDPPDDASAGLGPTPPSTSPVPAPAPLPMPASP